MFTIGEFTFDYVSIAFVVILLIGLIIGCAKGFFKILVNLIKKFAGVIVGYFASKPLAIKLQPTVVGTKIEELMFNAFTKMGGVFAINIDSEFATSTAEQESVTQALSEANVPSILHSTIIKLISSFLPESGSVSIANALSHSLTFYVLVAVCFVLICIVVGLLCLLLSKVFDMIAKIPGIGFLNRIFGMVFGLAIALFDIYIICLIISFIIPMGFGFTDTLASWMSLDQEDVNSLAKYLYNNNLIVQLGSLMVK